MKKERTILILENIKTLLKNERSFNYGNYGICGIISHLYNNDNITNEEKIQLKDFLGKNKPNPDNQFKEFCDNKFWVDRLLSLNQQNVYAGYWWLPIYSYPNNETRQIRIDYITKLIETLK